jgi:hypothetical protein
MKIHYDNPILICIDKIFEGVTNDGTEFDVQAFYTEEEGWQVERITFSGKVLNQKELKSQITETFLENMNKED